MAKEINFINDHVQKALDLLIEQFKDKEKWTAFITAIVTEVQKVEDVFKDLYLYRALKTAYGQQLDGIGQILVLDRNGLKDGDYRAALYFKAFLNQSKGEPETLLKALKAFTQSNKVALYEMFPCKCYGWFSNPNNIPPNLDIHMDNLCAGGVKWGGSIIGNDQPFVLDEGYKKPPDDVTLYGGFAIVDADNNLITDGTQGQFSIATG